MHEMQQQLMAKTERDATKKNDETETSVLKLKLG